MRKSRKFALVVSACMIMLVFAIAGTLGVLKVSAFGNLSDDVTVLMIDPATAGLTTIIIFTEDGLPPATLPVEVEADVTPITTMSVTPIVDGVDFVLNAVALNGSATTADSVGTGVNVSGTAWEGLVDLGTIPSADFSAVTDGVMTSTVISALASISNVYPYGTKAAVSAYTEFDSSDLDFLVLDAAAFLVDVNGDGKPDAIGLDTFPEGTLVTTGASGNPVFTVWRPLDTSRVGHQTPEVGIVLNSVGGAVFVDVVAPTLAAIQAVSTTYDIYDTGRLVLSVAGVPTDLLNGPTGVNPLGEFVGTTPPQNLFALVNIFVSDSTAPDVITQWLALKQLPGGLTIDTEISGPGVAAVLASMPDVRAYSYDTTNVQDRVDGMMTFPVGSLTDYGDQTGWTEITPTLSLTRVVAAGTENTIGIALPSASVITGSNITPRTATLNPGGGGGGGGGSCFIATAAYGTPLADDINVLRSLRDSYMLNNAVGTAFVDMYYRMSPPLADSVANNALMKAAVRMLLAPIVIVGSFVLAMPGASVVLLLLAGFAVAAARMRRRTSRT